MQCWQGFHGSSGEGYLQHQIEAGLAGGSGAGYSVIKLGSVSQLCTVPIGDCVYHEGWRRKWHFVSSFVPVEVSCGKHNFCLNLRNCNINPKLQQPTTMIDSVINIEKL